MPKLDVKGLLNISKTLYMIEQDALPRHYEDVLNIPEIDDLTQLDAAASAVEEARLALEAFLERYGS